MSMTRWLSGSESRQDSQRTVEDISVSNDQFTDAALELPLLGRRQKASSIGASLYLTILVLYAVVVIAAPWIFATVTQLYPAILCSCNVLLLGCTGLVQKHLSKQVKKERRQGFLKFSEHLKPLIHVPFIVLSYGTSGVLLIIVWSNQLSKIGVPVLLLVRLALLLEILWTGAVFGLYLYWIRWHNMSNRQPDVIYSLHSVIQPPTFLGDIRYLDGAKLAEQQALLLSYQQENLRYLHEEVLRLQESLSKYERSQDGAPQVDVVHILAAREQELRAMTAERDQLQSELRLARGLIAEREASVIQIRATNDRFVEENERLRSMLGEWSSRTAKLELALESERVSNAELNKRLAILRHANTDSTEGTAATYVGAVTCMSEEKIMSPSTKAP
ncbi:hypothetical protein GOP47_0013767 [Adiantum capillus-veneris]|uniref:Uncharacterized protein n=1 Tax=Adiantum capillus-veneris TaxID=13818 RepID=A0A9D4ZG34_ADICA|nr:hypothetical protein GOP47_0013767 [Adiantum capillus-veneris]